MSDETPVEDDTYYEGGARRAKKKRGVLRLPGGAGRARRARRRLLLRRHQGRRVGLRPVLQRRGLPRPRQRLGDLRGRRGRRHRRDRSQPQGRGRRRLRAGLPRRGRRRPRLHRDPGRLLRPEEGDVGRGRARGAPRPGQPGQEHRHRARGPARRGRRWRCSPRTPSGAWPSGTPRSRTTRRSGCPTTPRATRRATSSRRPTRSVPRTSPRTSSPRWSPAGARPPTRRGSRRRPPSWARRPAELMIIASLVEAEGRGDDMPKIAARHLQPARRSRRQGRHQRSAADRRVGQLRPRPGARGRADDRAAGSRTRPTTPTRAPACRRRRSRPRATTAIAAAANPADGDWYYYVTVDLATGETKFAETYDEFLDYKDEFTRVLHHVRRLLMGRRCGVLGDPIEHSLSPVLHRRATPRSAWTGRTPHTGSPPVGCPTSWPSLERRLARPVADHAAQARGRAAGRRAHRAGSPRGRGQHDRARRTGGCVGDNTDIPGAIAAIRERTSAPLATAVIIGGGATATSIGLALADLGVRDLEVVVREPGAGRRDGRGGARPTRDAPTSPSAGSTR